jgi:prepilin-type N-terminal cleavage/methylation domain-containing protein
MRNKRCAAALPTGPLGSRGFTTIELIIVLLILTVMAAVAIPGYLSMTRYLRIAGDARDLNGTVAQAKMRAAQDFTHARVNANLDSNTFQLEIWNKTGNGGAGCWQTDGDSANPCTATGSPVQNLSQGVTFGFGTATAANPNPQATIGQAPTCTSGLGGGAAGSAIANTACIEFNSRGIPIASSGSPTANDALYVTDGIQIYGVTVIISGMIQVWTTGTSSTAWQAR